MAGLTTDVPNTLWLQNPVTFRTCWHSSWQLHEITGSCSAGGGGGGGGGGGRAPPPGGRAGRLEAPREENTDEKLDELERRAGEPWGIESKEGVGEDENWGGGGASQVN